MWNLSAMAFGLITKRVIPNDYQMIAIFFKCEYSWIIAGSTLLIINNKFLWKYFKIKNISVKKLLKT